ncbi:polysaccharide biosynthesis tyrosine autokinase [Bradyrhizobium mercantei]|uniref:polysaccharide biosynthesis tyrosine autokinase n=1 Tax=Bradyrhizobium mercantei TaxID=1904807 RepID=UPI0011784441|nr:tyrosine-protein kinase domain-containing protein [Bradyrhizobium mercantei]
MLTGPYAVDAGGSAILRVSMFATQQGGGLGAVDPDKVSAIAARMGAGEPLMLDATKSRLLPIDEGNWPDQQSPWREGTSFRTLVEKVSQRRRMMMVLTLVGAVAGWVLVLAYVTVRVPAYSASSELLISNTTLQLSGPGPEAVVTQVLVENSLIESAIEVLRSGKVLERVIDKVGLDEVARISPRSYALPWSGLDSEQATSDAGRRQAAIELLRSRTVVKRVGASQIVSVRARALTAADAAMLTNEIAAAFVQELYHANAVVTTSAPLRERIKVLGPTARIISEAIPPKSKESLSAAVAMLLGIMLGGALGAGSGLVLTAFDRRLRAAEQVAAVTSVECFGYMPRIDPQSSLPSESDHNDLGSILRRSVLRRVRSAVRERSTRVPHIVGVTSCSAAEGKTTLATNLARFIARDGSPVLLIDASCPDVASGLAKAETPGLQRLLRGTAAPDDAILDHICPNLDFLPGGEGLGDLDLIWGNLVHAVNGGHERYEWILLDLPALSSAIDVRSAGQIIDDLIVVVEWCRTSEAQLGQALGALGPVRDRLLGTVINKVPLEFT